jgi:hypothetical protein
MSIRLRPATKQFLECQAEALNTSIQSLITMILDGVSETTLDSTKGDLRTIKERFFYLFQSHGLDLPSIVSVMKQHKITLSVLGDSTRLFDLIDQQLIQFLASTFHVNPKWISGADNSIIASSDVVNWYKNVHGVGCRLLRNALNGLQPYVMFIRRSGANFKAAREDDDHGKAEREPIGIVVRLHHTTADGVKFETFEAYEFERWNYSRCREQLKLLVIFCEQASDFIRFNGYQMPEEEIKLLASHQAMPAVLMKRLGGVTWYPNDYASLKDKVTMEIDDWKWVKEQYRREGFDKLIDHAREEVEVSRDN